MTWRRRAGLLDALQEGTAALWFTTNPGLEDVVAEELAEHLTQLGIDAFDVELRPLGFSGNVIVCLPRVDPAVIDAASTLRSVHHVSHPRYAFDIPVDDSGPAAIAGVLRGRGVADLEEPGATTFRVTTRRAGEHAFGSMDVQRTAGAALVERYGLAVDLETPDREIRVDVIGGRCLVGRQLTRESLSRRKAGDFHPQGALKANVAYAMLRFAGLPAGRLLDPFCGSATIPIEAAQVLPGITHIEASDYSPRAVQGARRNIDSAGLSDRIHLHCRDMTELPEACEAGSFDAIVSNPPFGVRLGRGMNFHTFYSRFLDVAHHLLRPGGLLVLLAWKRGIVERANRPLDRFRRNHVRVVETGGIYPRIYVLQRRDTGS